MRPFLFLGTRAEDEAADSEYAAILRCTGLAETDVRRVRLEREALGPVVLDDWSGILLGGGPFNVSDPAEEKSAVQRRAEAELARLAEQVVDADFPFLGACYGIGVLGGIRGGLVDRTHGEPIGCVEVTLSDEGRADPLLVDLPERFDVFLGHKEAVRRLPEGAVLLASSTTCPVQAFRLGEHVYATQFHPELDVEGLVLRIDTYREYGYFPPAQAQAFIDMARRSVVTEPPRMLATFVERYARP
ncbi:glutamine amidotransferase [Nocardioides euryhalodurans]|uniref:Glutamine amidotransferase n=1 Tax=Nocardioides euryhalodurans TaxID=2518370 RepID=A0A4P7GM00_9ACTN|nr:glutamine amidotransferase [Nocardioides euryhalodurans]QBR93030.1 glutamine amidotransferase [Nocardioides euryhalodurans]